MNKKKRAIRSAPDARKEKILLAAIEVSKNTGYKGITREKVAEEAGVSSALVATYFNRMVFLKSAVMEHAVKREIIEIVAQGVAHNDPFTLRLAPALKNKVMEHLFNKK